MIAFYFIALLMIASALTVVLHRNPIYSALGLVNTLFLIAVAFVTLEGDNTEGSDELVSEINDTVAKRIIWADDLPKTRSGKIMRRLLRDIAEGRALGDVTTLRDPDVMKQLEGKVQEEQKQEES